MDRQEERRAQSSWGDNGCGKSLLEVFWRSGKTDLRTIDGRHQPKRLYGAAGAMYRFKKMESKLLELQRGGEE